MGDANPTRRLFFALWPTSALQTTLAEATREVAHASGGRPVPPENFHITLAFLGSVPESRLSDVIAVGAAVAAEAGPMAIQVNLDTLEYWKKPGVLCLTTPADSAALVSREGALADKLKSRLFAVGFAPDPKPFRTHVTLARKVERPPPAQQLPAAAWAFTDFALVESRTTPEGPKYSVLATFPAPKG